MPRFFPTILFFFLTCFSCSPPTISQAPATTELPPPNILWLVAEDISPRFAAYGDSLAHTPNLDALAARSVIFDRAFTTSGVCAPSRSSIITGAYPTSIGTQHMRQQPSVIPMPGPPQYNAVPPAGIKAFPELLRAAGYWTASYRKLDYQFGKPFTVWDTVNDYPSWRQRNERDKDRPFFVYNTFEITHEINIWPDTTKERFIRDFIPDPTKLAPDVLKRPPFDEKFTVDPADVTVPPYLPDTEVGRQHIARLYDNASRMDVQIGNILNQLEEDGLAESTIIFFLSDHGDCLPRGKRWVYESGIHIPLTIYVPEAYRPEGWPVAGSRDGQLVSGVDLAPTVLEMAGVPVPAAVQGRSFLPRPGRAEREYVFAARDRIDNRYDHRRAVRDKQFKYIRNLTPEVAYSQYTTFLHQMPYMVQIMQLHAAGQLPPGQAYWLEGPKPAEELYDLEQDPYEINNLSDQPDQAGRMQQMRKALAAWQTEFGDYGSGPETEQAEAMWPGLIQPVTAPPAIKLHDGVVELISETEGATLAYQYNDDPRWQIYTEPFPEGKLDSLRARAIRYGYRESEVRKVGIGKE